MHTHHCTDLLARPRSRQQPRPQTRPDEAVTCASRSNRRIYRRRDPLHCGCGASPATYVYRGQGFCRTCLPPAGRAALAAARRLAEALS